MYGRLSAQSTERMRTVNTPTNITTELEHVQTCPDDGGLYAIARRMFHVKHNHSVLNATCRTIIDLNDPPLR